MLDFSSSDKLILLDFYATWCEPCKWVEPVLDQLLDTMPGQLEVVKIDVEEEPFKSEAFQVRSVPTLVLLKSGKEVWRMAGFLTAPELRAEFLKHL